MISIVIPVLNEAKTLPKLLEFLSKNTSSKTVSEIWVVDGGSSDGTKQVVTSFNNSLPVQLIPSEKGRALQMNTGAKHCTGTIIYFLHADTLPPKKFDKQILTAYQNGQKAGCFRMKFDNKHPILSVSAWFTRFNIKACRGGDQSLFITRKLFQELEGFNTKYSVYEDCEFINRIYNTTRFTILPDYVVTSARRYGQNGTTRLQYHFAVIHLKKWMGASPEKLYDYYQKKIAS